jgi:hypothetical protein
VKRGARRSTRRRCRKRLTAGSASRPVTRSVEGIPLFSNHSIARFAAPTSWSAGRVGLGEPIPDGAGQDDPLDTNRSPRRGASHPQIAQMPTDLGSSVDETLVLDGDGLTYALAYICKVDDP